VTKNYFEAGCFLILWLSQRV